MRTQPAAEISKVYERSCASRCNVQAECEEGVMSHFLYGISMCVGCGYTVLKYEV